MPIRCRGYHALHSNPVYALGKRLQKESMDAEANVGPIVPYHAYLLDTWG